MVLSKQSKRKSPDKSGLFLNFIESNNIEKRKDK